MLVLLFMAVTSSTSAELIAVSSLLTFDVYKTYINPKAQSQRLVQISHYGIVIYGLVLAAFCCILNAVGCNLTWILTVLGVIVGGAALPVGLVLLWPRMSTPATNISPWLALVLGFIAWFVTTWKLSGTITVATTGSVTNAVAGNLVSLGSGGILAVIISFVAPREFETQDAAHLERARKIQGVEVIAENPKDDMLETESKFGKEHLSGSSPDASSKDDTEAGGPVATGNALTDYLSTSYAAPLDKAVAKRLKTFGWAFNIAYCLIAIILVPFALFGTGYLFDVQFFTGWIVVSFLWVWVSFGICIIGPLVESRHEIVEVLRGLATDASALLSRK